MSYSSERIVAKQTWLWVVLGLLVGVVGTGKFNLKDDFYGSPVLSIENNVGQPYVEKGSWTLIDTPVRETLLDIDMVDESLGWAVGADGMLLKYEASYWQIELSPTPSNLAAIAMRNRQNGWAIGNQPLVILDYSDGVWEIEEQLVRERHYYNQNGAWVSNIDSTARPVNSGRYSIDLFNMKDGVIVGGRGGNDNRTTLFSLDESGQWESIIDKDNRFVFYALSLLENGQGWAVGDHVILEFEPGADVHPFLQPIRITASLNAVTSITTSEAWAVGNDGVIAHYDGDDWAVYETGLKDVDLFDIDMVSQNEGWAVGSKGTILHYLDGVWYLQKHSRWDLFRPTMIHAIDMISEDEGWAVGSYGQIWHYQRGE